MRIFSALSLSLLVLTATALMAKTAPTRPAEDRPVDALMGVAFRNITAHGGVSCVFIYDEDCGAEFRAELMGYPQIQVAQSRSTYWFWMKGYDPRRYYHCPSSEVGKTNIIPPMRPSFSRWVVNRDKESTSFRDGEYTVEITVKDGSVTRQRYISEGQIEAEVRVTAFQRVRGFVFPALAVVEMPGQKLVLDIDMGTPEVNPIEKPNTEPPADKKGKELAL